MSLSIGIVGLPNVGKSTLFNAMIRGHQAKVADYPFTTIEPNVGVVAVPDERLFRIGEIIANSKSEYRNPKSCEAGSRSARQITNSKSQIQNIKTISSTIEFVDIAGLVKDAHKGEGLGNKFLSHIREVDAILILLNGFDKNASPEEDLKTLLTELELADLEKNVEQKLIDKPRLVVLNVAEKDLKEKYGFTDLVICAKTEEELIDLSEEEQKEYLAVLGLKEPALEKLIKKAYQLLGLITFYTLKDPSTTLRAGQVQAWPIPKNTAAPAAAGKVHTDFEKGFIKAEVINYDDFVSCGGWRPAQEKGKLKIEGHEYLICDGDVVHFRFSN